MPPGTLSGGSLLKRIFSPETSSEGDHYSAEVCRTSSPGIQYSLQEETWSVVSPILGLSGGSLFTQLDLLRRSSAELDFLSTDLNRNLLSWDLYTQQEDHCTVGLFWFTVLYL
jgi:hypothetical protein